MREEGDETDSITAKPPSILISPATFASDDDLTERPESTVNEPRQQEDHLDDLEATRPSGTPVVEKWARVKTLEDLKADRERHQALIDLFNKHLRVTDEGIQLPGSTKRIGRTWSHEPSGWRRHSVFGTGGSSGRSSQGTPEHDGGLRKTLSDGASYNSVCSDPGTTKAEKHPIDFGAIDNGEERSWEQRLQDERRARWRRNNEEREKRLALLQGESSKRQAWREKDAQRKIDAQSNAILFEGKKRVPKPANNIRPLIPGGVLLLDRLSITSRDST